MPSRPGHRRDRQAGQRRGILNNLFAGVITDRPRLQQQVGPLSGAIDGLVDSQVKQVIVSPK
jgi:hypothetical protein